MHTEELLSELIRFRTEAAPGNEQECAMYIRDYVNDLHLENCTCDIHKCASRRANLVVRIGPRDSPGLLLSGHLDTVPAGDSTLWKSDPFEPAIRDGKLFGRGAAEMKAGLAAMLNSLKVAKRQRLLKSLVLVVTAGEEIKFDGLKNLLKNRGLGKKEAIYALSENLHVSRRSEPTREGRCIRLPVMGEVHMLANRNSA